MSALLYQRVLVATAALSLILGAVLASLTHDVVLVGAHASVATGTTASDIDWP